MTTEPVVSQEDREAAASFYDAHLARPGEVPVAAAMRMGHIDDSPLVQAFKNHRLAALTEARAREEGLREALGGIGDDYMTSETHHPGYVLIPTATFDRLRAVRQHLLQQEACNG